MTRLFKSFRSILPGGGDTPSEILAKALEMWGEDGSGWASGTLERNGKVCLIGAITKAGAGQSCYMVDRPNFMTSKQRRAIEKAEQYLFEAMYPGQKWHSIREPELHAFNDRRGFKATREVTCKALKRALEDEEKGNG